MQAAPAASLQVQTSCDLTKLQLVSYRAARAMPGAGSSSLEPDPRASTRGGEPLEKVASYRPPDGFDKAPGEPCCERSRLAELAMTLLISGVMWGACVEWVAKPNRSPYMTWASFFCLINACILFIAPTGVPLGELRFRGRTLHIPGLFGSESVWWALARLALTVPQYLYVGIMFYTGNQMKACEDSKGNPCEGEVPWTKVRRCALPWPSPSPSPSRPHPLTLALTPGRRAVLHHDHDHHRRLRRLLAEPPDPFHHDPLHDRRAA